jgi:hypothetical protein
MRAISYGLIFCITSSSEPSTLAVTASLSSPRPAVQTYLNGTLESPIELDTQRRRNRHHRLRRNRQRGPHEHFDPHRHRGARRRSAHSPACRDEFIGDDNDPIADARHRQRAVDGASMTL